MDGAPTGKLLLVEDEDRLRRLIAEFLRGEGHTVIEAADGREGAEFFLENGPFHVVLLDLNLPVLSGVEVCRRIKAARPLQPVLICSGAILDCHVAELHALNVDEFLSKPYHPLALLDRIARAMAPLEGAAAPRPDAIAHPGANRAAKGPAGLERAAGRRRAAAGTPNGRPASATPARGLFKPPHLI